ncbi:hypothetical protein [Georgenia thermotolerans]|uniref:Leucine rich repeat variant domain-containing protein n=1 Tax=Georgenia thermotolerans TaxID=527326 RepID=A0A7J5UKT6_9MICO|nr:hypothetical protein [Georgenia thermotolerans]KAE8762754.1 hypothetical protein GB883_17730 [Georgenia thermotolerans]
MPAPEQLTAYDASNPASPPGLLAQIAEHRPDLRPLVAANPATSSDVLARLAGLGDVAVDAALARRAQPGPAVSQPFAAPGGSAPAGAGGFAPPAPADFAAPGASGYGAPAATPYGSPAPGLGMPATMGYAGPGGPTLNSYAAAPGAGGYGPGGYATAPGSWGPAPKRSRTPMIVGIVVAVMGAVTGLGFLGYAVVREAASVGAESTYGSDEQLDYLWDACEAGDGQACDDLYWDSPSFSEYEDFGNTCGGREPDGVWSCADKYRAGASGDA